MEFIRDVVEVLVAALAALLPDVTGRMKAIVDFPTDHPVAGAALVAVSLGAFLALAALRRVENRRRS
jgi:hypothetical protein